MMSVDLGGLISKIPQEKLNELVNTFTIDTTAQEVLELLGSAGVDASEEEAQALIASLRLKDADGREVNDEELKKIAGGEDHDGWNWRKIVYSDGTEKWVWYMCPNCNM